SHPRVVRVLGGGFAGPRFYHAVEPCDGETLEQWLRRRGGAVSGEGAPRIALQGVDALEDAHGAAVPGGGRGGLHRGLGPPNVLLCGPGPEVVVKVRDFGLARALGAVGASGPVGGTEAAGRLRFAPRPLLLAPEAAGPEVDVWAVAACLYRMLTG